MSWISGIEFHPIGLELQERHGSGWLAVSIRKGRLCGLESQENRDWKRANYPRLRRSGREQRTIQTKVCTETRLDFSLDPNNKLCRFFHSKGDKCLVRILESEELWWFRAECLRVSDSKAQFILLESGKMVTALLKDIREFDPKCNFPSRTAICRIKSTC